MTLAIFVLATASLIAGLYLAHKLSKAEELSPKYLLIVLGALFHGAAFELFLVTLSLVWGNGHPFSGSEWPLVLGMWGLFSIPIGALMFLSATRIFKYGHID